MIYLRSFLKFNNSDSIIESVLLKAIHLSLDVAFVPIKKLVMLFHLYLQLFFGNVGKKKELLFCKIKYYREKREERKISN